MASDGHSRSERTHATVAAPLSETASAPGQRSVLTVAASVASTGLGAAATVTSRVLGFGALGVFLGIVAFIVEWATGLLVHPWEPWRYLVFLLPLVYAVVGALCLGSAGMWRGVSRVAMNLVEKHQLTRHILDRVFERAAIIAVGADTPEALRKPLHIQAVRKSLSQAIAAYSNSDDVEGGARGLSRAILRRLKLWMCRQVEARLLALIGEETRDASIAELTLSRLRERAQEELDGRVKDALEGMGSRQLLIWGALFAAVLVIPPLVIVLRR